MKTNQFLVNFDAGSNEAIDLSPISLVNPIFMNDSIPIDATTMVVENKTLLFFGGLCKTIPAAAHDTTVIVPLTTDACFFAILASGSVRSIIA
mmetsp:Transcript_28156/g.58932  ORF Transcript_28156/g.58932 Transcript_28156/m.58932 type:complete len:93 (-) Transcript_28156:2098-2376(-)